MQDHSEDHNNKASTADLSLSSTSHEHLSSSSTSSPSLAGTETRIVKRSKIIVYVCLLFAGIAVGVATYFLAEHHEEVVFQQEFVNYAAEIMDNAELHISHTVAQLESLATAISSFASSTDTDWPNFTLPHFEQRTQQIRELSGAELIAFVPIVPTYTKSQWEVYAQEHQEWIQDGLYLRGFSDINPGNISNVIYSTANDERDTQPWSAHFPIWQLGPAPRNARIVMQDLMSYDWFNEAALTIIEFRHLVITRVVDLEFILQDSRESNDHKNIHPRSAVIAQVTKTLPTGKQQSGVFKEEIVGFVLAVLPWEFYFSRVLPKGKNGFLVDVDDHCGSVFTYKINGHHSTLFGAGDMHDPKYDNLVQTSPNFAGLFRSEHKDETHFNTCYYDIKIAPTDEFRDTYVTNAPYWYALALVSVFLFTTGVFFMYDLAVQRRQDKVMFVAKRTNDIVTSLFPKNIQARIMNDARESAEAEHGEWSVKNRFGFSIKDQLKDAIRVDKSVMRTSAPIADFFPEVTIMFADLVGFTAWSSMREPVQVFTLLERVYCEFDLLGKRRRIFKVETVGDCYVAAAGLPDPRKDHAVAMARFARDCRIRISSLMNELEVVLGPDTGDLSIRIGLHSGPVTAGVLRGEKARFQLFGDTMNTTARIESTGKRNMIHLSEETANYLKETGKGHWVRLRPDKINAPGKGELTTYWLDKVDETDPSVAGSWTSGRKVTRKDSKEDRSTNSSASTNAIIPISLGIISDHLSDKITRLIKWNSEVLSRLLREVAQRRLALGIKPEPPSKMRLLELAKPDGMVLNEVVEVIHLPAFDPVAAKRQEELEQIELGKTVHEQLHMYLQTIAALYRDNPFHNFEHVSHVLMSVNKLLSRIVAPDLSMTENANEKTLHDHTYGITSDPLTQFAVVFAALIHDADHQGVTNAVLVKEEASIATVYGNKSVAEQNSVDIAWNLLMDESFSDLRRAIYTTEAEFRRFRQLVVNTVMATDIMDKELGNARKARWNIAFSQEPLNEPEMTTINRKATIVIDHLIQASDVAHTMQHWHIYVKWNGLLFEEMTRAFRLGRLENDPAETWYQGELGFFDYYIIPLARKLKDCGVFGVSSDEYLNYAMGNRKEWEVKGKEIVAQYVETLRKKDHGKADHCHS